MHKWWQKGYLSNMDTPYTNNPFKNHITTNKWKYPISPLITFVLKKSVVLHKTPFFWGISMDILIT